MAVKLEKTSRLVLAGFVWPRCLENSPHCKFIVNRPLDGQFRRVSHKTPTSDAVIVDPQSEADATTDHPWRDLIVIDGKIFSKRERGAEYMAVPPIEIVKNLDKASPTVSGVAYGFLLNATPDVPW